MALARFLAGASLCSVSALPWRRGRAAAMAARVQCRERRPGRPARHAVLLRRVPQSAGRAVGAVDLPLGVPLVFRRGGAAGDARRQRGLRPDRRGSRLAARGRRAARPPCRGPRSRRRPATANPGAGARRARPRSGTGDRQTGSLATPPVRVTGASTRAARADLRRERSGRADDLRPRGRSHRPPAVLRTARPARTCQRHQGDIDAVMALRRRAGCRAGAGGRSGCGTGRGPGARGPARRRSRR